MSIMPGIENFAPERTETSSGLSVEPSVAPAAFSSFLTCSSISRSIAGGIFGFLLVVDVADLGGDREPGRHRQAGVGHLGEARAFAAEQVLHVAVAVGLAVAEEIDVLCSLSPSLPFDAPIFVARIKFSRGRLHALFLTVSGAISAMSAMFKIVSRSDASSASRASRSCGSSAITRTSTKNLSTGPYSLRDLVQRLEEAGAASRAFCTTGQRRSISRSERDLGRLLQRPLHARPSRGPPSTSLVMFLTRLNSSASASKSGAPPRLRQRVDPPQRVVRLLPVDGQRRRGSRRRDSPRRSSRCASRSARNSNTPSAMQRSAAARPAVVPVRARRPAPIAADRRRHVGENLHDALRRAAQAVRIARAGRLLAGGKQADDRVELVGERHGRPRHRRFPELRFRRRRRRLRRRPAGTGSRSPSRLPRAALRARA